MVEDSQNGRCAKSLQSKIALKQTLTLKLGVTLVLTVTQVYVFVNLHRVTAAVRWQGTLYFQGQQTWNLR